MPISQQDKHLRHQRVRYELGKRQLSFARLASEAGLEPLGTRCGFGVEKNLATCGTDHRGCFAYNS